MPYLVILIHGISSDGAWQEKVKAVLEPIFTCVRVKYREYHLIGAVKIFFCPWSLLLSGLLLAFLIERAPPGGGWLHWEVVALGAAFLAVGLYEGLARREGCWLRAAVWFLMLGWLGLCTYLRSIGYQAAEPVLLIAVAALACHVAYCEFLWTRNPYLPLAPLLAGLIAVAAWLLAQPGSAGLLAVALGFLILFQEWRECRDGGNLADQWRMGVTLAFAAALASGLAGWLADTTIMAGLIFLLLLAGRWEPALRLQRALEKVELQINEARGRHGPGHLIAHSLGTCLGGHYLKRNAQLNWGSVILLGGALSERFDWVGLIDPDEGSTRIKQVRNEHGGVDAVIRLLRLAGEWGHRHHLGTAGFTGLRQDPGKPSVHAVHDVRAACDACDPPARLHNYRFSGFRHSDYFLVEHSRLFWLPYLLGLATNEYAAFLEYCQAANHYLAVGNTLRFNVSRELLAIRNWAWFGTPRTLAQFCRACLPPERLAELDRLAPARTKPLSALVEERAVLEVLRIMADAEEARLRPTDENRPLREAFDPTVAVSRASEAAFAYVLRHQRLDLLN